MLTSRQPSRHAASHQDGGNDEIATATPAGNAIPKASAGGTLAVGWLPLMGASGVGHAAGAVPDPGAAAGSTRYLREDATWATPAGGGGTVTSVALTMPAEFSIAGSPVTTSGTLAVTKANQSANLVYAGPGSGAAAAPAFRALVAADLGLTDGQIAESVGGTLTGMPLPNSIFDFRLTPTSGTPVITSDVTGAANLYLSPFKGNRVALYDGTRWKLYLSSELMLALGTVAKYQAYDVYLLDNSGTLTLEKHEWANATVTMTLANPCVVTWTAHGMSTGQSITFTTGGFLPHGGTNDIVANTQYFVTVIDANTFKLSTSRAEVASGTFRNTSGGSQAGTHSGHQPQARQTALATQDGVFVKGGDPTRRYVGTFIADSTLTTQLSFGGNGAPARLFVWNFYNQVATPFQFFESTNSWTYATAAYRQTNASTNNQVEVACGYAMSEIDLFGSVAAGNTAAAGRFGSIAIGEDSTTSADPDCLIGTWTAQVASGSVLVTANTSLRKYPAAGYHAYLWLERGDGTSSTTWFGYSSPSRQYGVTGTWWC